MPRQIRHDVSPRPTADHIETALENAAETELCAVRRANLHGRLYVPPESIGKRIVLHLLRAEGLVDLIAPTTACLGGWFARA